MNGLLKSWADSLKVFIPGNFKLFFLVTLKSFLEGGKVFLKYFWWLLLLAGGLFYLFKSTLGFSGLVPISPYLFLTVRAFWAWVMPFTLIFFWIASIRPSIGIKDGSYFLRYATYFVSLIVSMSIVFLSGVTVTALLFTLFPNTELVGLALYHGVTTLLSCYVLFFLLESDGSLRSVFNVLKQALMFIVYNLPGLIIFGGLFIAVSLLVGPVAVSAVSSVSNMSFAAAYAFYIGSLLFQFIALCFLHNYFIKRVHDHSELYYS